MTPSLVQILYRQAAKSSALWEAHEEFGALQDACYAWNAGYRRFKVEVIELRGDIKPGALVVARYSALPFYAELVAECESKGAQLIHGAAAHETLANIKNWYKKLWAFSARTVSWENFR